MEQKDSKQPRNPEKETNEGCSGNRCFREIEAAESYYITYKREVEEDTECLRPSPEEKFGVESNVFGRLERYAEAHCNANGDGDELCNHPCECKPVISGHKIKFGKIRKVEDRCQVFVEASIHIKCKCSDKI